MKNRFLAIFACSFLLVGCSSTSEPENFLLMPSGAPTLALYEEVALNNEVIVTTNTNEVKDNFVANNYKYLIFDCINGITFQNQNKSNYEFVSLLTGGNFHLIGINKTLDDVPTNDDYIIGFGNESLIPNKVYTKLYQDAPMDNLFASVTDLSSYLKSIDAEGKVNNQQIDWIFIAQPSLFSLRSSNSDFDNLVKNGVDINIKDKFKELYNVDYIPQAGLFVNKTYKENHQDEVTAFKDKVDQMLADALNNPTKVKETMHSYSEDLQTQAARYGFNENIMFNLQNNGANQFGIVDPAVNFTIDDINSFLNILK